MTVAPGVKPTGTVEALIWLQHCQRFGLTHGVKECELEVASHYAVLLGSSSSPGLKDLDSNSLLRISFAYLRFVTSPEHYHRDSYSCIFEGNQMTADQQAQDYFAQYPDRAPWGKQRLHRPRALRMALKIFDVIIYISFWWRRQSEDNKSFLVGICYLWIMALHVCVHRITRLFVSYVNTSCAGGLRKDCGQQIDHTPLNGECETINRLMNIVEQHCWTDWCCSSIGFEQNITSVYALTETMCGVCNQIVIYPECIISLLEGEMVIQMYHSRPSGLYQLLLVACTAIYRRLYILV